MAKENTRSTEYELDRRTCLKSGALALSVLASPAVVSTEASARSRELPNSISVVADDHRAFYRFTVSDRIEARWQADLSGADYPDGVAGRTAFGSVAEGGADNFHFAGEVTNFVLSGPATVYLNGESVNATGRWGPDLPESLVVVGDGEDRSSYAFTVSGTVEPGAVADLTNAEVPESVDGNTASGAVGQGGADNFFFSGTITEFSHTGPLTVYRSGQQIDPDSLGGGDDSGSASFRKLGQTMLSAPGGGYAEGTVRPDGRYAVVGTKFGAGGSYLVDLSDPATPREVHHLPAPSDAPVPDVKFDRREGLYYRTIQGSGNFDIVDYGYASGTQNDPEIIGAIDGGSTHNLFSHPEVPVLYTVNYSYETPGFDVYDVSDSSAPEQGGTFGPQGACHDVVVDPNRDLLHAAYQGGEFEGYAVFDVSDPRAPSEVGRFDYANAQPYSEATVGEEAFGGAHHADYDPRRGLAIVGDEVSYGVPGGKHVFDIGWRDGSPENPIPIGFTVSPDAKRMNADPDGDGETEPTQRWDWTGHDFDIIPSGEETLLASGDWHEGAVLYDITDPTNPHALDQYPTDDGEVTPNDVLANYGEPPWAWNASYTPEREFVVVSDQFTGLYTFAVSGD
ncbi:MAG TPA: hypothetical protein VFJ06_09775 [Halococcus sp.]|nr:hypothetical protein [Halococcus sp.]